MLSAMKNMLANRLCVTAEVLNNAVTDECLRMYKRVFKATEISHVS